MLCSHARSGTSCHFPLHVQRHTMQLHKTTHLMSLLTTCTCTTPYHAVTHDHAPHVTSQYKYPVHLQHHTMQSHKTTYPMSLLTTAPRNAVTQDHNLKPHATQSHRIITSSHISEQRAMQSRDMNAHVVHQYAPANYCYMFVQ